jgi:hypothetical protein
VGEIVCVSTFSTLISSFCFRRYTRIGPSALDNEMFSELWSPALAAFLVIFNSASDPRILTSIAAALTSMGRLAFDQNLNSIMDELVICIFQVSGLSNVESPEEDLVFEFGNSAKYQRATSLLMEFLKHYSSSFHNSWSSILLLFFNLLRLNIMPASAYVLDDFLDGTNFPLRTLSFTSQKPVASAGIQSIFGAVTSLFGGGSAPKSEEIENKHSADAVAQALRVSREFVEKINCTPQKILLESKFLPDSSLLLLVDSLMSAFSQHSSLVSEEKSASSFGARQHLPAGLQAKQQIFHLQLITDIVCQNGDRLDQIFIPVFNLSADVIRTHCSAAHSDNEQTDFVLEGAIVSFFKLASKFGSKESVRPFIISSLVDICSLNVYARCPPRACLQFLQGLFLFTQAYLHTLDSAQILMEIISVCRRSIQISFMQSTAISFLDFLVKNVAVSPWISFVAFDPFLELLLQTIVFSSNLNQSFELVLTWFKTIVSALPQLEVLFRQKIERHGDPELEDQFFWKELRFPIFQNLGSLCITNNNFIREQSLDFLHTSLLLLNSEQLGIASIRGIFEDVRIP